MLRSPDDDYHQGRKELDAVLERPKVEYLRPREPIPGFENMHTEGPERDFVKRLCALCLEHRDLLREIFRAICVEDVTRIVAAILGDGDGDTGGESAPGVQASDRGAEVEERA